MAMLPTVMTMTVVVVAMVMAMMAMGPMPVAMAEKTPFAFARSMSALTDFLPKEFKYLRPRLSHQLAAGETTAPAQTQREETTVTAARGLQTVAEDKKAKDKKLSANKVALNKRASDQGQDLEPVPVASKHFDRTHSKIERTFEKVLAAHSAGSYGGANAQSDALVLATSPDGYLAATYYSDDACSGTVWKVQGVGTNVCHIGFNGNATQSVVFSACSDTSFTYSVYQSPDCNPDTFDYSDTVTVGCFSDYNIVFQCTETATSALDGEFVFNSEFNRSDTTCSGLPWQFDAHPVDICINYLEYSVRYGCNEKYGPTESIYVGYDCLIWPTYYQMQSQCDLYFTDDSPADYYYFYNNYYYQYATVGFNYYSCYNSNGALDYDDIIYENDDYVQPTDDDVPPTDDDYVVPVFDGYFYLDFYVNDSCSSQNTFSVGIALGACLIAYDENDLAKGSVLGSCDGDTFTLVTYSGYNCAGPSVNYSYSDINTCSPVYGNSYGRSYNAFCSVGTEIPLHVDGVLVTGYDGQDTCNNDVVMFAAYAENQCFAEGMVSSMVLQCTNDGYNLTEVYYNQSQQCTSTYSYIDIPTGCLDMSQFSQIDLINSVDVIGASDSVTVSARKSVQLVDKLDLKDPKVSLPSFVRQQAKQVFGALSTPVTAAAAAAVAATTPVIKRNLREVTSASASGSSDIAGYFYANLYNQPDCDTEAHVGTTGVALGVCLTYYSEAGEAQSSSILTCGGDYMVNTTYSSLNCDPATQVSQTQVAINTCQNTDDDFVKSANLYCSNTTALSGVISDFAFLYYDETGSTCNGSPLEFISLQTDLCYYSSNASFYIDCATGQPIVSSFQDPLCSTFDNYYNINASCNLIPTYAYTSVGNHVSTLCLDPTFNDDLWNDDDNVPSPNNSTTTYLFDYVNIYCTVTLVPTPAPSAFPTLTPTPAPSSIPTMVPSLYPGSPTNNPTTEPSSKPSSAPTTKPTKVPTRNPTAAPSSLPTQVPSLYPGAPTNNPTNTPSSKPTKVPTVLPTKVPTATPSAAPSSLPTQVPSLYPGAPTNNPTAVPSAAPSALPTQVPSLYPGAPTNNPTIAPSAAPSTAPSFLPTVDPTLAPSVFPGSPTNHPSSAPTVLPTFAPTNPAVVMAVYQVIEGCDYSSYESDPSLYSMVLIDTIVACIPGISSSNVANFLAGAVTSSNAVAVKATRRLGQTVSTTPAMYIAYSVETSAPDLTYNSLSNELTANIDSGYFTSELNMYAATYGAEGLVGASTGSTTTSDIGGTTSHNSNDELSSGEVAGAVIGALLVALIALGAIYYFFRRQKVTKDLTTSLTAPSGPAATPGLSTSDANSSSSSTGPNKPAYNSPFDPRSSNPDLNSTPNPIFGQPVPKPAAPSIPAASAATQDKDL